MEGPSIRNVCGSAPGSVLVCTQLEGPIILLCRRQRVHGTRVGGHPLQLLHRTASCAIQTGVWIMENAALVFRNRCLRFRRNRDRKLCNLCPTIVLLRYTHLYSGAYFAYYEFFNIITFDVHADGRVFWPKFGHVLRNIELRPCMDRSASSIFYSKNTNCDIWPTGFRGSRLGSLEFSAPCSKRTDSLV